MLRPMIPCPILPEKCPPAAVWLLLGVALLLGQTVHAAPPALDMPIRCKPGRDCFIQNYFDHDPGKGWLDYACGHLSYDGHSGTDFRLPGMVAMHKGVDVIAAAKGVIAGLRDGEPDIPVLMRPGQPDTGKRAAGNGVLIDHGDGWETQYSHMRQGSIAVRIGQRVKAGERLGMVGLSGNIEFPHVDFTVRHNGLAVDPFSTVANSKCGTATSSLWKPQLMDKLRYRASGILISGWSGATPDRDKARNGEYRDPDSGSAALVFWIEAFGVQAGDRQSFEIYDPHGVRIMKSATAIPGNKAVWFSYAGLPKPPQGWRSGTYRAEYRLERKASTALTETRELKMP